jgi:endonuclease-3
MPASLRATSAPPEEAAIPAKERRERRRRAPSIAAATLARLAEQHPTAHCELEHRSPFELLVAVVLSAQTTDVGVNKATPKLFARYPDAAALAAADPKDVEPFVAPLGFFRVKAKSIVGLSRALVERHGGDVPRTLADLVKLPGVGRKTANVVLGVLWNVPEGVVVDTHVMRVSQRLGWTRHADPATIEPDLCAVLPRSEWDHASHVLIFHGRRCCYARKPECGSCRVNGVCPAAFDAEDVGRKTRPVRGDARPAIGPRSGASAAKAAGKKTSDKNQKTSDKKISHSSHKKISHKRRARTSAATEK